DFLSFCLSFGFSLCYNMPAMEDRRGKIILLLSSLFLLFGLTKQSCIVLAPYHGEIVRILRQLFHCAEYRVMTVDNKMKLPRAAESFDPIAGKKQFKKNFYSRDFLRWIGNERGPLRCTRQGNRCRLRAVVVLRFHSRLRLGSWIGSHRQPSPVDL